jgi:hypothetical protein
MTSASAEEEARLVVEPVVEKKVEDLPLTDWQPAGPQVGRVGSVDEAGGAEYRLAALRRSKEGADAPSFMSRMRHAGDQLKY